MTTGLRQTSTIRTYCTNVLSTGRRYYGRDLTDLARIRRLARAIHASACAALTSASVPNPGQDIGNRVNETALGAFGFSNWRIWVNTSEWQSKFNKMQALTNDTMRQFSYWKILIDVADTIYHESRHCEQWYRMARFMGTPTGRGGLGKNGAYIARAMQIPRGQANAAERRSLPRNEMAEARGWCESVYPETLSTLSQSTKSSGINLTGIDNRGLTYAIGSLKKTNTRISGKVVSSVSDVVQMRGHTGYHSLSEETDAHFVGDAVQQRISTLLETNLNVSLGQLTRPPHPQALQAQLSGMRV